MNLTALIEQHPLPWRADETVKHDRYFVFDAKNQSVVLLNAYDDTQTTEIDQATGAVTIVQRKVLRPGALLLARAIAALPEILEVMVDAHAEISKWGDGNTESDGRLESLIERLA